MRWRLASTILIAVLATSLGGASLLGQVTVTLAATTYEAGTFTCDAAGTPPSFSGEVDQWVTFSATFQDVVGGVAFNSYFPGLGWLANTSVSEVNYPNGSTACTIDVQLEVSGTFSFNFTASGASTEDFTVAVNPRQNPTAPANLALAALPPGAVQVTWAAATDNTQVWGYGIYRNNYTDGAIVGYNYGAFNQVGSTGAGTLQFTDTSTASGTAYFYAVAAFDRAGHGSPASNSLSITATCSPPPAPANLTATLNSSANGVITLSWSGSCWATSYKVYRDVAFITTTNGMTSVANGVTATTYTDTVSASGTYFYAVVSTGAAGDSGISNCANVTVAVPPSGNGIPVTSGNSSSPSGNSTSNANPNASGGSIAGANTYLLLSSLGTGIFLAGRKARQHDRQPKLP
jgi:hypothetical protein